MPNPPAVETRPQVENQPPLTEPPGRAGNDDALGDPLTDVALQDGLTDELAAADGAAGEQQRDEEGTAEGLASYEAALGTYLGKKLYDEIAPHLTLEKIAGYADDGLKAALKELVGQIGNLDDDVDDAALDRFVAVLNEKYATLASEYLKGDGKALAEKLAGWVDTHPRTIVALALLAAGGAIAANLSIPRLETEFGIGDDLTVKLGAKLGKLRQVSLERITAELAYQAKGLNASYSGSYDQEGDAHAHTVKAGGENGGTAFSLQGDARFQGDDLEVWGVGGRLSQRLGALGGQDDARVEAIGGGGAVAGGDTHWFGAITLQNGDTESTSTEFDPKTGKFTFLDARKLTLDGGSEVSVTEGRDTQGGQRQELGWSGDVGEVDGLSASGSLERQWNDLRQASDTYRGALGLKYATDDFSGQLETVFGPDSGASATGKADARLGGNLLAGGGARLELSDLAVDNASAYFGYRDPDEFTTFMSRYAYSGDRDAHTVELMMEKQFGPVYTRFKQSGTFSGAGQQYETSAHGAYFVDDDMAVIAGGKARYGSLGNDGFTPEVGVQIKGVPLTVGYDTGNKAWTVGITIPFGR